MTPASPAPRILLIYGSRTDRFIGIFIYDTKAHDAFLKARHHGLSIVTIYHRVLSLQLNFLTRCLFDQEE